MNMKSKPYTNAMPSLPLAYVESPKFKVRVRQHRNAVLQRFPKLAPAQRKHIDLVLNEAEALAWQTPFPHLVFPTLAEEMAETLAKWQARQAKLSRAEAEQSLAV